MFFSHHSSHKDGSHDWRTFCDWTNFGFNFGRRHCVNQSIASIIIAAIVWLNYYSNIFWTYFIPFNVLTISTLNGCFFSYPFNQLGSNYLSTMNTYRSIFHTFDFWTILMFSLFNRTQSIFSFTINCVKSNSLLPSHGRAMKKYVVCHLDFFFGNSKNG